MDHKPDRPGNFFDDQSFQFDKEAFDLSKTHQDWQMLRQRIHARGPVSAAWVRIKRIGLYQAVAVTLLFLAIAAGGYFLKDLTGRTNYATDFGEVEQVKLPDGSLVTLNANSRLYFYKDWDKWPVREVWLEGEAFFTVRKRKNAGELVKFLVHMENLDVEVLGTRFNVKERRKKTRVTLTSGSVKINVPGDELKDIVLQPGEQAAFSNNNRKLEKRTVETQKYIAWTKGKLILDHKTLAKVAEIIEETYGKKVIFRDRHLKKIILSGSYPLDDMDKLLHALRMAAQITIVYDNDKIIFEEP